jgi:hypothetical protein
VHSVSRRPPQAAALYPREPDRGKSHPWRVFSAAASLNTATPNPAATKASALAAPSPSLTIRGLKPSGGKLSRANRRNSGTYDLARQKAPLSGAIKGSATCPHAGGISAAPGAPDI